MWWKSVQKFSHIHMLTMLMYHHHHPVYCFLVGTVFQIRKLYLLWNWKMNCGDHICNNFVTSFLFLMLEVLQRPNWPHTWNLVFQGLVQRLMLKDNKKVIKHSVLEAGLAPVLRQKKKKLSPTQLEPVGKAVLSVWFESGCSKNKIFSYFCYVLTWGNGRNLWSGWSWNLKSMFMIVFHLASWPSVAWQNSHIPL